jgi:Astacin (Peptidase family M12A)
MADEVFGVGELRSTKVAAQITLQLSSGPRVCKCSTIDGRSVVEGDIVLTRGLEDQGIVVVRPGARWPDRTVVYDVHEALPNPERVAQAIEHWQDRTPIRFKRRRDERDYVLFRPGDGCSSAVGRIGGVQWITLGGGCSAGNAIHEIGHTVGLWHEQSRADRDEHVRIEWSNIDPGFIHNFDQHLTDGDDVGAYDFGSIMHYPANAFALDPSKPTIVVPGGQAVGQRTALSEGDIAAVKQIYT